MSIHKSKSQIPIETARDELLLWAGGKKKKPYPIRLALCAQRLVNHHNQSFEKAAENVDLTARMMRYLVDLALLIESSDEAKKLIEERKIGIEVGAQIYRIKDLATRTKILKLVPGMTALDARELIRFARKYPRASFGRYKQRILGSKDKTERIFAAVVPLEKEEYQKLMEEARKRGTTWDRLCSRVIKEWLKNPSGGSS